MPRHFDVGDLSRRPWLLNSFSLAWLQEFEVYMEHVPVFNPQHKVVWGFDHIKRVLRMPVFSHFNPHIYYNERVPVFNCLKMGDGVRIWLGYIQFPNLRIRWLLHSYAVYSALSNNMNLYFDVSHSTDELLSHRSVHDHQSSVQ